MGFQDILNILKERVPDRFPLSDLNTPWDHDEGVECVVSSDHISLNTHSLLITGLGAGKKVYSTLDAAVDLHKQNSLTLHIYSTVELYEGDIEVVLSDSEVPEIVLETCVVPDVPNDSLEGVSITLTNTKGLSNVRSIGIKSTKDLSAGSIYIAAIQTTSQNYNTTIQELELFEAKGLNFVLNEIGEDTIPVTSEGSPNPKLQEAVYLAAAGKLWMKAWEQDAQFTDFNSNTYQKPYGVRLISDAAAICKKYLTPSSSDDVNPLIVIGGSRTIGG